MRSLRRSGSPNGSAHPLASASFRKSCGERCCHISCTRIRSCLTRLMGIFGNIIRWRRRFRSGVASIKFSPNSLAACTSRAEKPYVFFQKTCREIKGASRLREMTINDVQDSTRFAGGQSGSSGQFPVTSIYQMITFQVE